MASGIASALGKGGSGGGIVKNFAELKRRKAERAGNSAEWKSSVDERLGALEQGGDASSQSIPDIGAAPVSSDLGGAASEITGGVATDANFSPQTKAAAEGMFGTEADRDAIAGGEPNVIESPEVSASAELGALFEKPETSYSAIGG
jgi:hypothetical protein